MSGYVATVLAFTYRASLQSQSQVSAVRGTAGHAKCPNLTPTGFPPFRATMPTPLSRRLLYNTISTHPPTCQPGPSQVPRSSPAETSPLQLQGSFPIPSAPFSSSSDTGPPFSSSSDTGRYESQHKTCTHSMVDFRLPQTSISSVVTQSLCPRTQSTIQSPRAVDDPKRDLNGLQYCRELLRKELLKY